MRKTLIVIIVCLMTFTASGQGEVALKTNLLYGVAAFTPNLGIEIGLSKRITFDLLAGYNWFNKDGFFENNKKKIHWILQPELRYFMFEKFNRHFFGVHGLYSLYNISEHKLPILFGKNSKNYRFEGSAIGAGVSYGYQLILLNGWNIEFNFGVGYTQLKFDKYNCTKCGSKVGPRKTNNYWGPTKAALSLIYIINK